MNLHIGSRPERLLPPWEASPRRPITGAFDRNRPSMLAQPTLPAAQADDPGSPETGLASSFWLIALVRPANPIAGVRRSCRTRAGRECVFQAGQGSVPPSSCPSWARRLLPGGALRVLLCSAPTHSGGSHPLPEEQEPRPARLLPLGPPLGERAQDVRRPEPQSCVPSPGPRLSLAG